MSIRELSPLRLTYLVLAILGAGLPIWRAWDALSANGPGAAGEIGRFLDSPVAAALLSNIWVASAALAVWLVAETRVRRNWAAFWALPAVLLFGPGCGLPLYLFLRTRKVD